MKLSTLSICVFVFGIALISDARAQTIAEQISLALQKNASNFASENGIIQAAFNSGLIAHGKYLHDFPEPPDTSLQAEVRNIEDAGSNMNLVISWFPQSQLGGAFSIEGTGDFTSWLIFSANKRASHEAPMPDILQMGSCYGCDRDLELGSYKNTPVAFLEQARSDEDGHASQQDTIAVQSWTGTGWSDPTAFQLNLKYTLNTTPDFLSCLALPCTEIERLGYEITSSFYRTEKIPPVSPALTASEAAQYATSPQYSDVENALGNLNYTPLATDRLPIIDGQQLPRNYSPEYQFNPNSVLFPTRFQGRFIIGRIGHGTIGWRVDTYTWHVAFWRFDGANLVPIGAMIISLNIKPSVYSVIPLANWHP